MTIIVTRGTGQTAISRLSFIAIFEASVVATLSDYARTLESGTIRFTTLVDMARKAQIPYVLCFAPASVVAAQVKHNNKLLLAGVSKGMLSLNSRGRVRTGDIELIVKDIARKQGTLKRLDPDLPENRLIKCLKGSKRDVETDARFLVDTLGIDRNHLLTEVRKERAFDYLIDCLESRNVYVSQAVRGYMPQAIPKKARFSGICIKDNKLPFIFLNGADGNVASEPAGRRVFTLTLLLVCMARGKFMPVNLGEQSDDLIDNHEYELAEEILMPAASVRLLTADSLDDVRAHAGTYCVTPSAFTMRALRLKLIDRETSKEYMHTLRTEYRNRESTPVRQPKPVNALRKYNSAEYSRSLLKHLDAGRVQTGEVVRILFRRKFDASMINDFRQALS